MFNVYERELLGKLILNYLTKITLPKSISNQLGNVFVPNGNSGAQGPPQFLKKRSENAWANENLSLRVPINSGNRSGSCSEIVVFVLLKS